MIAFIIFFLIVTLIEIIRYMILKKTKSLCSNPNCNYKGYAQIKQNGSFFMFLFLMILGFVPYAYLIRERKENLIFLIIGVIPASIYYIFKSENYYICPKCGTKVLE